MTDITKYKSLAADLEDYAIVAEIRKKTGKKYIPQENTTA